MVSLAILSQFSLLAILSQRFWQSVTCDPIANQSWGSVAILSQCSLLAIRSQGVQGVVPQLGVRGGTDGQRFWIYARLWIWQGCGGPSSHHPVLDRASSLVIVPVLDRASVAIYRTFLKLLLIALIPLAILSQHCSNSFAAWCHLRLYRN